LFDDLGDPTGPPTGDALERVLTRARRRRATQRSAFALVVVGAVAALAVGASALGSGSNAIHVEGTTTTNPTPTTAATTTPSTSTSTSSPSATTTTTRPTTEGRWTDARLTITPVSLGSVRIGMTFPEAETAAGAPFDGHGDGAYYPTSLPTGFPHLFVNLGAGNLVSCFGAEIANTATPQVVQTADGFRLGDTVQQLLAIYGSRAHFMQASAGGISPRAGYVVAEPDGRLAFYVDTTGTRILGIKGGGVDVTPSSCNG
jgi:hypothetical protein